MTKALKAEAAESAKKMAALQKQANVSQKEAAKTAAAEKKIEGDAAKLSKNEVRVQFVVKCLKGKTNESSAVASCCMYQKKRYRRRFLGIFFKK